MKSEGYDDYKQLNMRNEKPKKQMNECYLIMGVKALGNKVPVQ